MASTLVYLCDICEESQSPSSIFSIRVSIETAEKSSLGSIIRDVHTWHKDACPSCFAEKVAELKKEIEDTMRSCE